MTSIVSFPPVIDGDYLVAESWVQRTPKMGDHIRVQLIGGLYAHNRIYVPDDEVIHFT